jgi:lipopolysaccharide transport system permease protein
MARVLTGFPDLALSGFVLVGMIWWYGLLEARLALWWLPVFALLAFVTALGVGLWLSALNVQYRDIQHVVPFLVQVWLFATPIAYPSSLLTEPWRTVYGLNPMVGVVEGFRWALLGSGAARHFRHRRVLLPTYRTHLRRCRLTATPSLACQDDE